MFWRKIPDHHMYMTREALMLIKSLIRLVDSLQMILYDTPGVIEKKMHKLDSMMMKNVRRATLDADCAKGAALFFWLKNIVFHTFKLVKLRMAEFRKEAVTYIEQGHVRVGMETVADPVFHVTRNMQDFITWVDSSSFRRKVLQYHQKHDDYDVMA
ncbi:hypothetical protein Dimus_029382 [Dionaea muscipula]